MKFTLEATVTFSRSLDDAAKKELDTTMEAAGDLLLKGAPKGEGGRIDAYSISPDGTDLSITLSSQRYVRPHDAVFRLKNFIAASMGKSHKVGVRKITGKRYEITFDMDNPPKRTFQIPFTKETLFEGTECRMILGDLDEEFLKNNYVDRMVSLVKEKVEAQYYEGKSEHWKLIWQSPEKEHHWDKDPTTEMAEKGWIMHRGRGQWIFGPRATQIMRTMEGIVLEELIKPLGFDEVIVPKAVTWDVWKKSGHAKNLYGEMYYLCQPKTREREYWEEVTDTYKITGEVPLELIRDRIKEPMGGVSYAQCPPLWPFFDGKTLSDESLPVKVFDRSGTSMRYESGGIHGIERVDEFHRIEIVWIGYPKQVKEIHAQLVEAYKKIFNEILEIEWRMAWVTPWFMAQEGLLGEGDEELQIGTIDFEAYLPYRGTRKDSEWLEFQNASNNGDKYPKGFNVKSQGSEGLMSGCTGIGLERWLATFTAQKGLEPDNWPAEFKRRMKQAPKDIRFL